MKTLKIAIIAATLTLGAAPAAIAEVEASATIASSYLWRGVELGSGTPALSADVVYSSESGLYAGLWLSSGDKISGGSTEYDLFVGYAGSIGDLTYDIGYASYMYPTSTIELHGLALIALGGDVENTGFDDNAEYISSIGYGDVAVTHYVAKDGDYTYTTVGYEAGDFAFTYGDHDGLYADPTNPAGYVASHFDVSYAVNDSLSLTMSTPVNVPNQLKAAEPDTTFVAAYSLPF
ncbi:MAG: TorF family putative porin [Porticoccaceae bacterium]|nr:TorF family putative porin [Porticoccaceae bacterium]